MSLGDDESVVRVAGKALGRWYSAFNRGHPFREGNGRSAAIAAIAAILAARRVGVDLDFSRTTRERWVQAGIDSLAGGSRATPAGEVLDAAAEEVDPVTMSGTKLSVCE